MIKYLKNHSFVKIIENLEALIKLSTIKQHNFELKKAIYNLVNFNIN